MDFYAVLDRVVTLLRQRGRVTYRALKRQFQLDDETLGDLREELTKATQVARDENGEVLVWVGDSEQAAQPGAAPEPSPAPITYTPPHLAERIRAATVTDGERKVITVLF